MMFLTEPSNSYSNAIKFDNIELQDFSDAYKRGFDLTDFQRRDAD